MSCRPESFIGLVRRKHVGDPAYSNGSYIDSSESTDLRQCRYAIKGVFQRPILTDWPPSLCTCLCLMMRQAGMSSRSSATAIFLSLCGQSHPGLLLSQEPVGQFSVSEQII